MIQTSLVAATVLAFVSLSSGAFAACNNAPGTNGLLEMEAMVETNPAINIPNFIKFQTRSRTADNGPGNGGELIFVDILDNRNPTCDDVNSEEIDSDPGVGISVAG